ncbi:MAG: hypothetical protein N3A62_01790 [Thermodesulfovibrionales bacterium]|nr:hypothetical protein [Thermodesulfovibrionales bacterium]
MVKRLLLNINLINTFLVILITFLTFTYLLPSYQVEYKKQYQVKAEPTPDDEDLDNLIEEFKPLPLNDYLVISDLNLFHPDRKIPPLQPQKVELPKPDLVLYGTLISTDTKIAYIEDLKAPVTTPGRGKRQKAMKIGESIGGFVLKEIHPDRIVLFRGEESMVVNVIDPKKKRHDAAVQPPSPTQPSPPKKR